MKANIFFAQFLMVSLFASACGQDAATTHGTNKTEQDKSSVISASASDLNFAAAATVVQSRVGIQAQALEVKARMENFVNDINSIKGQYPKATTIGALGDSVNDSLAQVDGFLAKFDSQENDAVISAGFAPVKSSLSFFLARYDDAKKILDKTKSKTKTVKLVWVGKGKNRKQKQKITYGKAIALSLQQPFKTFLGSGLSVTGLVRNLANVSMNADYSFDRRASLTQAMIVKTKLLSFKAATDAHQQNASWYQRGIEAGIAAGTMDTLVGRYAAQDSDRQVVDFFRTATEAGGLKTWTDNYAQYRGVIVQGSLSQTEPYKSFLLKGDDTVRAIGTLRQINAN